MGVIKGDSRSLDNGSCGDLMLLLVLLHPVLLQLVLSQLPGQKLTTSMKRLRKS